MTKKKKEHQYVLRTCNKDMTAYNGFKWPKRGHVTAPDWANTAVCGHGLHGALWGEGNGKLFNWDPDAIWQVVKVTSDEIIDLKGKVKFESGYVVFTGDRKSATDKIIKLGAKGAVIGAMLTVSDNLSVIVGDLGIASAGNRGTASAGYEGTASAGDLGIASAGDHGTAIAGDRGTASVGAGGTASAGDRGTASVGECGTASAGTGGEIHIRYYDYKNERYKLKSGYIGENGLKPNTYYKLNNKNEFEEVK